VERLMEEKIEAMSDEEAEKLLAGNGEQLGV
jgi:hypothetical protein